MVHSTSFCLHSSPVWVPHLH